MAQDGASSGRNCAAEGRQIAPLALYRAHHAFVRNCLRRSGLDESELDGAVQDVFTTMLGRAGEPYDRARSVRPWRFGISRNLAANARRRGASSWMAMFEAGPSC